MSVRQNVIRLGRDVWKGCIMNAHKLANEIIEGATACDMTLTEYLLANFSYKELGEIEQVMKKSLAEPKPAKPKRVRTVRHGSHVNI